MTANKQIQINWLVEHCAQSAYALAIQIVGNVEDAQDIVQQSYTKVIQQKTLPNNTQELSPWFKRIVRNTALDSIRKKNKWQKKTQQIQHHQKLNFNGKPLSSQIENNERKNSIETCLKNLSSEQRELIVLRDYHDYSYAEIAKILDIAKGTVMSRLHRARLALRKELKILSQEGQL